MSRRTTHRTLWIVAALVAIAALPAIAAEGRIPVPFTSPPTTPITISTGGKYILTRNISPTGPGNTIEINLLAAGGSVDLDLNGFSVSGNAGANVILVAGPASSEVRISNGSLVGGATSINVPATFRSVTVEGVRASVPTATSINLPLVSNVVVKDSVIVGVGNAAATGILVGSGMAPAQARIEGNLVQSMGTGVGVTAPQATVAILNNRILQAASIGIDLHAITSLVAENTIRSEGGGGILMRNSTGCKVFDNVISRGNAGGIIIDPASSANLIWRNVIREIIGAPAILVQGDANEIAGNVMNENSCGLEFVAGADNNIYRENMARLSAGGPAVCAAAPCAPNFGNLGAGNSTAGNNFVPTGAAPCN